MQGTIIKGQKHSNHSSDIGIGWFSRKRLYFIGKRFFDIVCSMILLVILAIPIFLLAIIIFIDSQGPVFFSQERLGQYGKPFKIHKFRSMKVDAEKNGPQWAEREDARCTRVGRILRRSRLDEIPQLWNILKGEMSFVGPRPERAYFYHQFEKYIPGFRNRLVAKPGLTGLAQVNGGYELPPEKKIIYDMKYIENQSFWMDLKCIMKTFSIVLLRKDAR